MKKGDLIKIKITDVTAEGNGVGRIAESGVPGTGASASGMTVSESGASASEKVVSGSGASPSAAGYAELGASASCMAPSEPGASASGMATSEPGASITEEGQAGENSGLAVFVSGALPGDTVSARIRKLKKRYAVADLISVEEPSPDRVESICPYSDECGGCVYASLDYSKQLEIKEKNVYEALRRLGGLEDPAVKPMIGAEGQYLLRYRNKAVIKVDGKNAGFFARKSHRVVDCQDCLLQAPTVAAVAECIRRFQAENGEALGRCEVTVRTAFGTGEVMVIMSRAGRNGKDRGRAFRDIPGIENLIMDIDDAIADLGDDHSLECFAEVDSKGKASVIAGTNVIKEEIEGRKYEISPMSFFQVNPVQMARLYDKVLEYAAPEPGDTILDLYCGCGSIGQWIMYAMRENMDQASDPGVRVIGIESVKSAVIDANRNAVLNGFTTAVYTSGKAETVLPKLIEEGDARFGIGKVEHVDIAIIDPPRAGCDETLLYTLCDAGPDKMVYVSCDPATLARDIRLLTEHGYEFIEATPVEMFGFTGHCEVVVSMSRVGSKQ